MFKKGTKLFAIFNYKCPRCHEGELFETSVWNLKGMFSMYNNCQVCGQKYILEPGFYWGAMYVAYMLSAGIMLGITVLGIFLFNLGIKESFGIALIVLIPLYGVIFRTARSVWINLYVHYNPGIKKL
jgi:uncharacterized protein (DUF983 family)